MVFLNRNPPTRKQHAPIPIVEASAGVSPLEDHRPTMLAVLAEAGCALRTPSGPPLPPSDPHKLRRKLETRFSASPNLLEDFLSGFSSYIDDSENLKSVLIPARCGADLSSSGTESLARMLLLVPQLQLQLQKMLLEKLPEHFGCDETASMAMEDDVARLIIHHFRWLDFLVDCKAFVEKLLEVLTICPIQLKKDIIGSLPEIIGDESGETVVSALERMLQEDSEVVVPVLDSFSNLSLDDQTQEQVVTIALSCIRTIDAEHMPFLLRFLLLSATPVNAGRIIAQIREHLIFTSMLDPRTARNKKLKGKSIADNADASILEALRSSLRFKNILCEAILKELKTVDKPRDHKVIDVWLIMLIHANGGSLQKNAEKIIKKKIADGSFSEFLFDQCIRGHRVLAQVYFTSFLSLCEYLVACREKQPRDFGIYMYNCLFEEFVDTYSRQEVLGALVTHIGSGVVHEVNAALETMVLLTSKHSKDMLPLSSYISGVLDFLEGFNWTNLHKVYEIFSRLALSAQSSDYSVGPSIANELLLIVRKQINNQDLKYKRMGIIGTLKLVAFLGDTKSEAHVSSSQKTNSEEALELLNMSLESCKFLPLALILFYDELVALLESITLHPSIMEWMCKHAGEFESKFLSDLEGGQLSKKESYGGLEGELWMNLDGDLSPICLSILPLLSSSEPSLSSLQVLPANFQLLCIVERLTNQGSLGGIDALLGCPLHLPSPKYFVGSMWKSLTGKQKQIVTLSLYYAINWLRELLSAFSSQVAGKVHCISQNTREEMIAKLLKRLKNLVFLEGLLNISLKCSRQSLPKVHSIMEHSDSPLLSKLNQRRPTGIQTKDGQSSERSLQKNKRKHRASSLASEKLETNGKHRQQTILDVLKRAGVVSQEVANEVSSGFSCKEKALPSDTIAFNEKGLIEISTVAMFLDGQNFKFRPLVVDCLFILSFLEGGNSCSSDTAAELPIHLYLLRDFHYKLDYLTPPSKQSPTACAMTCKPPAGLGKMTTSEFLHKIRPIFPSLNKQLHTAISILNEGPKVCEVHWDVQSASSGNPDIPNVVFSQSLMAASIFREVLCCFEKMLNLPDLCSQLNLPILIDLLAAFQPSKIQDDTFLGICPSLLPGDIDYLFRGAYLFLEDILDIAHSFSLSLASSVLASLESLLNSIQLLLDQSLESKGKNVRVKFNGGLLPILRNRLGDSACKILSHDWGSANHENEQKNRAEIIQKTLRIYLKNNESTSDLLDVLASSTLPQDPCYKTKTTQEQDLQGFPMLCSATFIIWYRVLHEENLEILKKLLKRVGQLEKSRAEIESETVKEVLTKLRKSVNVVVSLVHMCKTHDKVIVHATAVKYGGNFVDSFLKVFNFLQANFEAHNDIILQMVKELQKATRTIQIVCSEAKGLKRTMITTKIPTTKRSMERFLFHVKALLHNTSNGETFWMGNLKHKDLFGQVVSSQVYANGDNIGSENVNANAEEDNHMEAENECEVASSGQGSDEAN